MIQVKKCKCGSPYIVNKKYGLCNDCNYERINGRPRQEVYQERAKERANNKAETSQGVQVKGGSVQNRQKPAKDISELKKLFSIKKISSSNRYRCSDGSTVSQAEINRNYTNTCDKIKQNREPVCEGHGVNNYPLSFSHTISRARCKELGKTELIWDPENLFIEGYHEPSSFPLAAHNIWEVGNFELKKTLLNFTRKIEYIKVHDPEHYLSIEHLL